jgi:hypothetical protein
MICTEKELQGRKRNSSLISFRLWKASFNMDTSISLLTWELIRDSFAPVKVVIFNWQLWHQRLPMRLNLLRRCSLAGVSEQCCSLCSAQLETKIHLFVKCSIAWCGVARNI